MRNTFAMVEKAAVLLGAGSILTVGALLIPGFGFIAAACGIFLLAIDRMDYACDHYQMTFGVRDRVYSREFRRRRRDFAAGELYDGDSFRERTRDAGRGGRGGLPRGETQRTGHGSKQLNVKFCRLQIGTPAPSPLIPSWRGTAPALVRFGSNPVKFLFNIF